MSYRRPSRADGLLFASGCLLGGLVTGAVATGAVILVGGVP